MDDTDLVRSERIASRLATGYTFGRRGAEAVPDRDWIGAGAEGSTPPPATWLASRRRSWAGRQRARSDPRTRRALATMFDPHHRPDPRLPGLGLGFARRDAGGHRLVGHDGILPGFNSGLLVAPDDGVGVVAFTNGSKGAFMWMETELKRLIHRAPGRPGRGRPDRHPEASRGLAPALRPLSVPPEDLRPPGTAGAARRRGGVRARRAPDGPGADAHPGAYRGLRCIPTTRTTPPFSASSCPDPGRPRPASCSAATLESGGPAIHADLGGQPPSLVRAGRGRAGRAEASER